VATVIVIVVIVIMVLWVLTKAMNSISKSTQKMSGKNRCQACGSRLKAVNGRYMPLCRKCGTTQTWAE
jgi:ribosomal protein S14